MKEGRPLDATELARLRSAYSEGVQMDQLQRRFKMTRRRIRETCAGLPRPERHPLRRCEPRVQGFM